MILEVMRTGETMDENQDLKDFAAELVAAKARAGELGLYKTMQALEPAVTAVGYEIAEIIENQEKSRK